MERIGIVLMILLLPVLIIMAGITLGQGEVDDHEFEVYLDPSRQGDLKRMIAVVATTANQTYSANCSECHLDYSPNLLPSRSWKKMMGVSALEDHFGEYLFLEEVDRLEILNYLISKSAERSLFPLPKKILRSIASEETPLRIREVRAIFRRHDKISERYTIHNQKVLSLSQCNACHQQADRGVFDREDVFIPYQELVQGN